MKVYLDNAATTMMRKEVRDFLIKNYDEDYANPSAIHSLGRQSRVKLENARNNIANILGIKSKDLIFTSGATESNNLAIKGILAKTDKKEIITSKIEHSSIYNIMKELENKGYKIHYVKVKSSGEVDIEEIKQRINENTALICVMAVNNETGVIQPLSQIAEIIKNKKIYFHVDAVQALGKIKLDIEKLDIDSMSFSAHKIYGPKGVGLLYLKDNIEIEKQMLGGQQERNKRAGTENLNSILATEIAVKILYENFEKEREYIKELNEYLLEKLNNKYIINGKNRIDNIINIQVDNKDLQYLLPMLDMKGIMISAGSACMSGSVKGSRILYEMGLTEKEVNSSIRISLGIYNTREEIDYLINCLEQV